MFVVRAWVFVVWGFSVTPRGRWPSREASFVASDRNSKRRSSDAVIVAANSAIPGARLELIKGAAHLLLQTFRTETSTRIGTFFDPQR